jgi:ABC-type transport system involved in multi-copper enzyme maturation permease subunit
VSGRILAIALNTFREAIRNKVLYGVIAVVVGANAFALVLAQMSLHQEARIVVDVGLAGISLFGSITAIVIGISLLYNEIQKKTIQTILSKPIERHEFVLGKYLGMALTLTLLVALFALVLAGLLVVARHMFPGTAIDFSGAIAKAVLLGYLEVLVVAAIAIFFSSFSTPYLSGIFTFALFFLGRISEEIRLAAEGAQDAWIRAIAGGALRIVPDLHVFAASGGEIDGRHASVHGDFVGWGYVGVAGLYAAGWIAILLLLAALIFRRRDFA